MKFYRAYVELTNICGLACTFCPPKTTPNTTMSPELFESVLLQLAPYTKEIACHLMGDPLTLSNLKSYLDLAHTHGFKVNLTTSGFLIGRHDHATLFHPAVRQLNISLNSYDKNSTRIALDDYLEPILALCRTKLTEAPELFINLRLWNLDEPQSDAVYNRELFARFDAYFGTAVTDHTGTEKASIRLDNRVLIHFDRYFRWPSLQDEIVGDGPCHGLISQVGILADGRVVPCCLDGEGIMTLGNLARTPLAEILNTPRACAIRDGFKASRAVEELCRRCHYKTRFQN